VEEKEGGLTRELQDWQHKVMRVASVRSQNWQQRLTQSTNFQDANIGDEA
jgi:hypothetical protein